MCSNARGSASKQWVRQFVLVIVYLSIVLLISLPIASCLESKLYPFDVNDDLSTVPKDDGGSPLIRLDVDFPFFGTNYRELYVSNNGIISFKDKLRTDMYRPLNFDDRKLNNKVPFIAPYWSDVDIEHVTGLNETVLYRITYNDSQILNRSTEDIRNYFDIYSANTTDFSAELVLIVTWYNVGFYGAMDEGVKLRNTFQAVLVTDGAQSYAIFNYDTIVWTTGANSRGETHTGLGGLPAVVGFHSGNNASVYNLGVSGTDAVVNVDATSNVNKPGVWVFKISGPTVDDLGCFSSTTLEVNPRKISMLGREQIHIKGPCLNKYSQPKARFLFENNSLEFDCVFMSDKEAMCVTPTVFRTGEITLQFDPDGRGWVDNSGHIRYNSTVTSIHLSDLNPGLTREKPENWLVGRMVTASWDQDHYLVPEGATLEVLGYHYTDDDGPSFRLFQTLEVQSVEESKRKFKLLSTSNSFSSLISRLCWSITDRTTLPLCIWSDVFPVRWQNQNSQESREWCENWIIRERTQMSPIVPRTPNCPCGMSKAENDPGHFHADPYCDKRKTSSKLNCVYNKDAQQCYRRNIQSAMNSFSGETCCYDNKGTLMDIREKLPGAGTHQRYHYRAQGHKIVPFFSYFESDLLPKLHCCQFSKTNCSDFYTLRNATDCVGYTSPSPAQAAGDPHLVTLDGKGYSFNGVGDFILVQDVNSSVVIQVRAEQATDKNGTLQQATVFTSVAVSAGPVSDVIEVRKQGSSADILVNKALTTIDSTTSQFRNVSLQKNSTNEGSYLIVLEPVSVSVTVEVTPDLLNIMVLIGEDSLKGHLQGLLGNYNGIPDDDFIPRSGSRLLSTASERQLHYDFGMTWEVTPEENLLSPPVASKEQSVASSYVPVFIDEIIAEDLPPGTIELCGSNKQCQFDYQVTGKESVAKSTAAFTNKFEAIREELEKKDVRCPFLDYPENGNRTVPSYSNGSIATFWCNPGYEMIQGQSERLCQDDSTWSGSDVVCAVKIEPEKKSYTVIIIAGASAVGLALLVIIVCGVVLLYRRIQSNKIPDVEGEEEIPRPGTSIELSVVEQENIPIFANPVFLESLHSLTKDGRFRIPRPDFIDPRLNEEYF